MPGHWGLDLLLKSLHWLGSADPNAVSLAETVRVQSESFWNGGSILFCTAGFSILIIWAGWYNGFQALRCSPVRRNRLSPFAPLAMLLGWLFLMVCMSKAIAFFFAGRSQLFREAMSYPAMAVIEIALIGVMLYLARRVFARGLKGFGFRFCTITQDLLFAFVNLIAVYALVIVLLWGVLWIGTQCRPDFGLQEHQSLTFLEDTTNGWGRFMTAAFAVLIVPVFEEMLFRGFWQTTVRSFSSSPWLAIILTSLVFAVLHPITHAPALFALSCGLGYAYERSGSLLRPILMHVLFNGLSVMGTFLSS